MATTVNYLTTVLLPSSAVLFLLFVATHCDGFTLNVDLPQHNQPMETTTQPTTTPEPAPEKCNNKCNQLRLSPNKTSTFYNPKEDLVNRESLTNKEICPHIIVTCRDNADNDKDTVTMQVTINQSGHFILCYPIFCLIQFNNGQGKPSTNTVLLKCNANKQWEYQPADNGQPKQEVTEISCKGDWKS